MSDHMFEETFVDLKQGRKTWLVIISFLGQMSLVFLLALIPLVYTDALPRAQLTSFLVSPPPPPPPPPPPTAPKAKPLPRQFDRDTLRAPKQIPLAIASINEEPLPPPSGDVIPGSVPGAAPAIPGGTIGILAPAPAPVAPPPPIRQASSSATPPRLRVGGIVQQANLIRRVQPVYPPLAKQARIQGVVHFTAIIGRDGGIQDLQLINGHPLLIEAARQAVSQWQ